MTIRQQVSLVKGVLIISIFLPIVLSIWLANRQAHDQFIQELSRYTTRVLTRTELVTNQAKKALQQVGTFHGDPCSPAHLQLMRQISYTYRFVQEVLWLKDSIPQCSSLNNKSWLVEFPPPERITPDGYRAWLTQRNDLDLAHYMVALERGQYMVMIDPASFIDVLLPLGSSPIESALIGTQQDKIIASSKPVDMQIWQQLKRGNLATFRDNGTVYNLQQYPDLKIAILTWSSVLPLEKHWHRQLLMWLPIGILISLLASFFILRVLRRLQSPHYRMLNAINAGDISVHYQPIVSLQSGKISGAEALARWQQPDGTWVSPGIFIPLAEQHGLIMKLTECIINNVFRDMGKWLSQHPELHISINLSMADLQSPTLPQLLSSQLNHWQIHPSQIALELTERDFVDPKTSIPVISAYQNAGHAIYIDDFGTGYSSLSYLQDLDVNTLKIDKSFVDAFESKSVTSHVIEMAKSLGLTMVAEGIETTRQHDWLHQHGVQYGQGWLYSKALPKIAFIMWAENNLKTT